MNEVASWQIQKFGKEKKGGKKNPTNKSLNKIGKAEIPLKFHRILFKQPNASVVLCGEMVM